MPQYMQTVAILERYRRDFPEAGQLADEVYKTVPGLKPEPEGRDQGLGFSPADEGGRRPENILP